MKRMTATAAAALVGVGAFAQGITAVYAPGKQIKDQNISVRGWGSGTIAETDETAFQGVYSLRVSTRNFFQGGSVLFGSPVDLTQRYTDPSNMLRLTFKVADANMTLGPGSAGGPGRPGGAGPGGIGPGGPGPGGRPGVGGGPSSGGRPGSGGSPFQGGPGIPNPGEGGLRGPGMMGQNPQGTPSIKNLRFVITTTDGKKSEAYVAITSSGSGERGWRTVAVPLQRISGFDRTNKQIRSIALSADATGTFYVGDITVLTDTTPLSGEPNHRDLNLALGDEVEFVANGFGGSSILRYTWDFDSKDGIQEDAEGQAVRRKFRKPGDYTVTMTVHDKFGLKKPYSTTVKVKVNP